MIRVPVGRNVLTIILFCIILLFQLAYCQDSVHYDFKNCTVNLDSGLVIEKGSWYKSPDSCSQGNNSITSGSIECPNFANISIKNVPVGQASFTWKKSGASTKFEFYIDNELSATCKSYKWVSNPVSIPEGNHTIKWVVRFDKAENGICIAGSEGEGWLCDVLVPRPMKVLPSVRTPEEMNCFSNESVLPENGSILCPFNFSVKSTLPINSMVELQTTNLPSNKWESVGSIQVNDPRKKIVFGNIRFFKDGIKKYRFLYNGLPSKEYDGPEVFPLDQHVYPSEGSNLNRYNFCINRTPIKCCIPFDIFLEIEDHDGGIWKNIVKGIWGQKNITFNVTDLSFTDPFIGNMKYRFRIDDPERWIGPFIGPHIYINFKNFIQNSDIGMYSCDIRSDRCSELICLKVPNRSYEKLYTKCDNWDTITWNIPPSIDPMDIKMGNCNE